MLYFAAMPIWEALTIVLVGLHWLFAVIAFRNDNFATLVKGKERVLIRDGEIQWSAMRKSHIGERDLLGALQRSKCYRSQRGARGSLGAQQ